MKNSVLIFLSFFVLLAFVQCKSPYQLEEESNVEIGQVYYQNWIAGIEGAESGSSLYIPIIKIPKDIVLDSVYFNGNTVKVVLENENLAVGKFKKTVFRNTDLIMSNEPFAEYGNPAPKISKSITNLNNDECVISYLENGKMKYLKVAGIIKKESLAYPFPPPQE